MKHNDWKQEECLSKKCSHIDITKKNNANIVEHGTNIYVCIQCYNNFLVIIVKTFHKSKIVQQMFVGR